MTLKIVATIGPATEQNNDIRMLANLASILRTNGSHNTLKWHEKISTTIKSINSKAIHLFDIPGIKPRTKNKKIEGIKINEKVCFYYKKKIKTNIKQIELTKPLPSIKKNRKFFSICDGQYFFKIISFKKNYLIGKSSSSFDLYPKKGLNIPGAVYDDKMQLSLYKNFLNKSKNINFDAIGLSYVQSKKVINIIKNKYSNKIIISKIENQAGLTNHKEIIEASDVIMIDRGDLAAEVGNHNLFDAIIKISLETKKQEKPLIVATENLSSMVEKNEPTKSEIVSLGISTLLQSDYIMLSEETAISVKWRNTINWLKNFIQNTEYKKNNYHNIQIRDGKIKYHD
ncbi:pyruvate kinase [Candidatus Pelagibacter sp.]|nr:pyruvate kinase [Candidatus Pelagibacter sp.]